VRALNDPALCDELIALVAEDDRVRSRLAADGSLFEGYHPEMAAVHRRNAARVHAVVAERGWPREADVGERGVLALWRIVQHAIGDPPLQRTFLAHLESLAGTPEDRPVERAMLDDRIRVFEGRPQRYGTQFDWDADGDLSVAGSVEEPDTVDRRRAQIGLPPLAEAVARQRASALNERAPRDREARQRGYQAWLREVGWR
jgi:hypothetical protein